MAAAAGPRPAHLGAVHAKGDVAARGTASDLLLMMWNRITPDRLDVFGDGDLLTRWQRAARF